MTAPAIDDDDASAENDRMVGFSGLKATSRHAPPGIDPPDSERPCDEAKKQE
jgi:hypothetical protein